VAVVLPRSSGVFVQPVSNVDGPATLPDVREPDHAPSLLEILRGYDWHERAACRDEPNPGTFFPDITNVRKNPNAPGVLLPLLICDTCPVRRRCLEESMRSWSYVRGQLHLRVRDGGGEFDFTFASVSTASGTWGGVTELERLAERDRPVPEAIERLERMRESRLRERIRGYLRERRNKKHHRWRAAWTRSSRSADGRCRAGGSERTP
jgi:Transcription factor WhiB